MLTCTTNIPEVAPDRGGFRLQGETNYSNLPGTALVYKGSNTVEFKPVTGYTLNPASRTVNITQPTTEIQANYVAQSQVLTVNSNRAATAKIGTGSNFNIRAGDTTRSITTGQYTIYYNSITGYTPNPAQETFWIDTAKTVYVVYDAVPHAVTFTATPAEVVGKAKVREKNTTTWYTMPVTLNIPYGSHVFEYLDVTGYKHVADKTQNITGTITINAQYLIDQASLIFRPQTGYTTPSGARAKIDGGSLFNLSNSDVSRSVDRGNTYLAEFNPVNYYQTPASQSVTVALSDSSKVVTYKYIPSNYTVAVRSTADGVVANSGATVTISNSAGDVIGPINIGTGINVTVPYGTWTFAFSEVTGYNIVANQSYTINNDTRTVTAAYVMKKFTLTITSNYASRARIDGGTWFAIRNGNTTQSVTYGSHTIEYEAASGYTLNKTSESFTMNAAKTVTIEYTEITQHHPNTIVA
jgi:hypothetical protein